MEKNNKQKFEKRAQEVLNILSKGIDFNHINPEDITSLEIEKDKLKNKTNSTFISSFSNFEQYAQETGSTNETRG